ncbi:MAG: hypothetical protein IJF78_14765 [Clostridia bacterium]|nr:hypothetical protein [Clostridia bacterium]
MEHIWNIGGREYFFDVSESETMNRLNGALASLCEDCTQPEGKEAGDTIRHHCTMIGRFFDSIFGEGAGRDICGERLSAEVYTMRYVDFIVFVNRQVEAFSAMCREIEDKYLGTLENIASA